MKSHPILNRFPPTSRALRFLVAASCLGGFAAGARAQTDANIGVRTKVTDAWVRPKVGEKSAEGGHGKVFGILAVAEIKSDRRLVKPVDEQYLQGLLLHELSANGFRPYTKGQNPDILLTLSYGRGELENPYVRGVGLMGGSGLSLPVPGPGGGGPNAASAPVQILSVADFTQQYFDDKTPGNEAKLQKAIFEKLYIRVTAWEFPKSPAARTKMLWKTIIVADDPDHRDLNLLAAAMLAAGAPYFDKETKEKEIDLYRPVPDGRVLVGTPEVVENSPAKSK